MFIRNGLQSNLRSRGRTALFAGMILVLTLVMILALGVRLYCDSALARCDELYRSIAMVEYMGTEYPARDEPDPAARAAAAAIDDGSMEALPGVSAWYRDCHTLSRVEGFRRQGNDMPYRECGVIVATHLSPQYDLPYELAHADPDDPESEMVWVPVSDHEILQYYTSILTSSLYSYDGKEQVFVSIVPDYLPEDVTYNASYVLHGTFVDGDSLGIHNGIRAFLVQPFADSDESPIQKLEPGEKPGEIFYRYAEHYRTINNYVHTVASGDLNDLWEFHQGVVYVKEGAMPTSETECVISGDLAETAGLSVGDTVHLTAFDSSADNRYQIELTDRAEDLTVCGITNTYAEYAAYVWRQAEPENAALFGYRIGVAELKNRTAIDTVEAIEAMMPDNVRVTLLDQGYADAVEPFLSMQSTATNVLLLCAVGTAAVLVLFALLFVGRQSDTVRILVSLGTPRRKIALWLLSGALVIAGGASLLGGILGVLGLPAVFRLVQRRAAVGDGRLRFSETLITSVKQTDLTVHTPLWPMALTVLVIILLALVLSRLFINVAYCGGTLRQGRSRVRVPRGKTSTFGAGSLRYAFLSVRRGGPRALLVIAVSALLAVIVIVLGSVYRGWEDQLDSVLHETKLEGQVTSTDGRYFSGLNVSLQTVREMLALPDVDELYVSDRIPYWLEEDIPAFGSGGFAQERRADWIGSQPDIVAVNGLRGAKEFYFTEPVIQWVDGWDESCLADDGYPTIWGVARNIEEAAGSPYPAVVGDAFMEAHDLAPDDTFTCMVAYSQIEVSVSLHIVGVYKQTGNRAHIYVPLASSIPPDLIFGGEAPQGDSYAFRYGYWNLENYRTYLFEYMFFTSCRFTLSSAAHLDETRQRLDEAGFGWPGHLGAIRTTLVLRDSSFIKQTETLDRSLSMGRVMLGLIFGVVALLGFIISWLLISGRKREFAVMRGFGVKKGRLFLSFFWEQALLCLLGCALGALALVWLYRGGALQPLMLGGYVIFYLAGCAVSVILIGRMNLMELLSTRE